MADKPHLNLVVTGHVDHGKSTTMGHFLLDIGAVDQRTIDQYASESEKTGSGDTFKYACVMDSQKDERERGVTIDLAFQKFQTSKYINRASLNNNSLSNNKKSKWSYWSHGDISIGRYEDTIVEKPKHIKTTGLTFGADKKYGDNKFAGLAIRYGENGADIRHSAQQTDMESLTLNIYGTFNSNYSC